jgi:hypothetical protein
MSHSSDGTPGRGKVGVSSQWGYLKLPLRSIAAARAGNCRSWPRTLLSRSRFDALFFAMLASANTTTIVESETLNTLAM